MYVELQRRAETLNEGNGAGISCIQARSFGSFPRDGEEGADAGLQDAGEEPGVAGEQTAQSIGEREDPLSIGNLWKHVVCEVDAGIRCSARAAGRTDAAFFAGEGDEEILAARIAAEAEEAAIVDAASQVGVEMALDVSREAGVGQGVERRVAILLDGLVQGSAARIPRGIAWRGRQGPAFGTEGVGMGHLPLFPFAFVQAPCLVTRNNERYLPPGLFRIIVEGWARRLDD